MMNYKKEPRFMNVPMLADYIKLSKSTIYQLVSENRIPHLKVLSKVRFVRDQIDTWMLEHQVKNELPVKLKY
jgi:excisionase family DNA binding protein